MSFLTALSGLNAAQTEISSTSNNIANVDATGYHKTRVEFSDIYTSNPFSNPVTEIGIGTQVSRVNRSFNQGSIEMTSNSLDMAIQGAGFFKLQTEMDGGQEIYSRAGAFGLDADGYVVNSAGNHLASYKTADNGDVLDNTTTEALRVPPMWGASKATGNVGMSVNMPTGATALGSQDAVPASAAFDPTDATTYAHSTPINMLDPDGLPMDAMMFFSMTDAPDAADPTSSYTFHLVIEGVEVAPEDAAAATLSFDEDGFQVAGDEAVAYTIGGRSLNIDMSGSQLNDNGFSVMSMEQDGEVVSKLAMLEVDDYGVVWGNYGQTESIALGMIAVSTFSNLSGLQNVGNSSYAPTRDSGEPVLGHAGMDGFGSIRSGALESSNVDLTEELVNLITAQRNYQASAKALETNQTLASTIMNMRG